jgi:hypothetical protein
LKRSAPQKRTGESAGRRLLTRLARMMFKFAFN